jgi:hypothetical protein
MPEAVMTSMLVLNDKSGTPSKRIETFLEGD